jgi:hypothetical protein
MLIALAFSQCRQARDHSAELYLESQIRQRISHLEQLNIPGINARELDNKVNDLLLLTKDIENLPSVVQHANNFFNESQRNYALSDSGLVLLETDMHIDHMALLLRQNELNLLNRLIFKLDTNNVYLYTAQ